MAPITAIVDTQTNEFVESGHATDARYQVKTLSRNPNAAVERWHPTLEFVAKTAQEISDAAAAQADAAAAQQFDGALMLKAKAISDLAWRLGKAPGALTAAEIAAERTRILNIYKTLG